MPTTLRRAPRAALVLWQATAVAAVLAALLAAPAAAITVLVTPGGPTTLWPIGLAVLLSGVVAGRLLLAGDRVGRSVRSARRTHRELVDLLAVDRDDRMRVLEHSTPTAYCVPGLRRRVVVTQGALDSLRPDELEAVFAHERAHLDARHDLVLEFFTVMHSAVPGFVRSAGALHSVTLLIEVLADRAGVRSMGPVPTARAIVAMVGRPQPVGTLAMGDSVSDARLRIDLLEGGPVLGLPNVVGASLMYAVSAVLVLAPVALLVLTWVHAASG